MTAKTTKYLCILAALALLACLLFIALRIGKRRQPIRDGSALATGTGRWFYQTLVQDGLGGNWPMLRLISLPLVLLQPGPDVLSGVAGLLDSEDAQVRGLSSGMLLLWHDNASGLLQRAMDHPHARVRGQAAWLLGRSDDPSARETLVKALLDPSARVRLAAANSLQRMSWRPETDTRALQYAIARQDWKKVLLLAGKEQQELVQRIQYYEPRLRRKLIGLFERIAPDDLGPLSSYLDDPDWNVRQATAAVLKKLNWQAADSLDAIRLAIASRDWPALEQMGTAAIDPLFDLLEDNNLQIREHALDILERVRDKGKIQDLLDRLQSPSRYVRRAAADMLDSLKWEPKNEVQKAHYWLAKQEWHKLRTLGAYALEPLIERLQDSSEEIRHQVVLLLKDIPRARSTAALVSALRDRSLAIRSLAADCLDDLHWEPQDPFQQACYLLAKQRFDDLVAMGEDAVGPLIDVLQDANQAFRQQVARTLRRITGHDFAFNRLDWRRWWRKQRGLLR